MNKLSTIVHSAVYRMCRCADTHRALTITSCLRWRIGTSRISRGGTWRNTNRKQLRAYAKKGTKPTTANREPPAAVPDICATDPRAVFNAIATESRSTGTA
jgi:hypothetical protein